MINKMSAYLYCKDDISTIENYEKAIADTTQTWHCHHRDEVKILPSGIEVKRSKAEMIENDRYYHCPANELIFLTKAEHNRVHFNGNKYGLGKPKSVEAKRKVIEAHKGKTFSEFGAKFREHYGKTRLDDLKLYKREWSWYSTHNNKCRWE